MIDAIKQLVLDVSKALPKHGLKLVTAESCTGGGLSYWLTSVPGSSNWFDRGFVTYSNVAKSEMIGVNPETIETFGAVSEETAREMAEGALQNSQADLSIAITGIAGPDGGSSEKPVGTVWIGWAGLHFPTITKMEVFTGDRQEVRLKSIAKALEVLLTLLKKGSD